MNNRNENPSIYNSIYWLIQDRKIEPSDIFKFLEFFWPSFIQKENHIFLKENFSEEKYYQAIKGDKNPEFWINLLTVDDFFEQAPDQAECSADLAKKLVQIWQIKLKLNFPSKKFAVEYLHDDEYGDFGLTFYQIKKSE